MKECASDSLLHDFEQAGGAHAAADAHRDDDVLALRRRPSIRAWPVMRAPVMPYGWPIEIEPPLTLSLSLGMPSLSRQ